MKAIAIIGLLAVVTSLYFMSMPTHDNSGFEAFIAEFQKSYNTEDEYNYRRAVFESNVDMINRENAKGHTYTLGVNQFADLTLDEFKSMLGYIPVKEHNNLSVNGPVVPKSDETIDWKEKGDVNDVRNQGACGSCWAFSAVAALEGAYAIKNGALKQFSEQQLVDCDTTSSGCNGGEMFWAFQYYEKHGACFRENYLYTGYDGQCKASDCESDSPKISSYVLIEKNDPTIIHTNLAKTPLSLGVAAGNSIWQFYSGGVVSESSESACGHRLDHGVLMAGYHADEDAWQIKNSWGTGWGRSGYIYIQDNHMKDTYGICGVNMEISYPVY